MCESSTFVNVPVPCVVDERLYNNIVWRIQSAVALVGTRAHDKEILMDRKLVNTYNGHNH